MGSRAYRLAAAVGVVTLAACGGGSGGAAPTYTISGSVLGLTESGLTLTNNGGAPLSVAAHATSFSFPATSAATYQVAVAKQPANPPQTCTVSNGSGTAGQANVTSVRVSCVSIGVSLLHTTVVVQPGASAVFTADVANDSSNSGVQWSLSCPASPCGSVAPTLTASGATTTYTPPAAVPSADTTMTLTATSVADATKSSSATVIPVGQIPGYQVGVDFHAFNADIDQTGFLGRYNQPQVRQMVRTWLQQMVDRGVSIISTGLWVENGWGTQSNVGLNFPPTSQEMANLRVYVQDVAGIVSATGQRLLVNFCFGWLGPSDYTIGTPTTTLGNHNLNPADFIADVQETGDEVLAAVAGITRPDGINVIDTIYFMGEATLPDPTTPTGPITATGWFLVTNYPHFVATASKVGIRPAVYFGASCDQGEVFDDYYSDYYPALNGHRSMWSVYRGVKFFVDNGLPLPPRVDFACFLKSTGAPWEQILERVLDDADATLPSLGAPKVYGFPEAYYMVDPIVRRQLAQAYATLAAENSRLQRVSIWSWPGSGGTNQDGPYPFTMEDFLPPPQP